MDILAVKALTIFTAIIFLSLSLRWLDGVLGALVNNNKRLFLGKVFNPFNPIIEASKLLFNSNNKRVGKLSILLHVIFLVPPVWAFSALLSADKNLVNFEIEINELMILISAIFFQITLGFFSIWDANNKYSMLSAIKTSILQISYLFTFILSFTGLFFIYGTYSLKNLVVLQDEILIYNISKWAIFYSPISALIFLICTLAINKMSPFRFFEENSNFSWTTNLESSGEEIIIKKISNLIWISFFSTLFSVCYLGGGKPFWGIEKLVGSFNLPIELNSLVNYISLFSKILISQFIILSLSKVIPKFNFRQAININNKILIPIGILNIFIALTIIFLREQM